MQVTLAKEDALQLKNFILQKNQLALQDKIIVMQMDTLLSSISQSNGRLREDVLGINPDEGILTFKDVVYESTEVK